MKQKYYLLVLGCQMNKSDAERVASVLENLGYAKTANENDADVIVAVACSVRQSAVDRIYGKINLWQKIKTKRPLTTILTGCVLPPDKEKLTGKFDFIFDITELPRLTEQLHNKNMFSDGFSRRLRMFNYLDIHATYQNNFSAYVPVSTGCNNYCSYCVVPYVRGKEKSRPAKDIIDECKKLIANDYKEIILIGQNVNSYGQDLNNGQTFPDLLKAIDNLPGGFWLRFCTSHPKDMSDELIKTITECDKMCKYIHLPVQSGDNKILKKMNRNYTREHYLDLIKKIRKAIPDVAIGTDVIVGFPGETKQQFKNTVKLFKETKFDMAYIAQYSPRCGTAAFQLKDDVLKEEKQRRERVLTKILKRTTLKNNKKLIGKTLEVLVEEVKINHLRSTRQASGKVAGGHKTDYLIGKTRTFKTVKIVTNRVADDPIRSAEGLSLGLKGQFVKVKTTKARSFGLEGVLVK